jgi:hypothetical protein
MEWRAGADGVRSSIGRAGLRDPGYGAEPGLEYHSMLNQ